MELLKSAPRVQGRPTCRSFDMSNHYAHSVAGRSERTWEPLKDHLDDVAGLTSRFASGFAAGGFGELAGRWHDLGKYSRAFQDYLRVQNGLDPHFGEMHGGVDHSTAGAQHAFAKLGPIGRILAYVIAGHHAGLADARPGDSSLAGRLTKVVEPYDDAPSDVLAPPAGFDPAAALGAAVELTPESPSFQIGTFIRMLFSCLVDGDFLATEAFLDPRRQHERDRPRMSLADMRQRLSVHLNAFVDPTRTDEVYRCRQEVLAACRSAASGAPGLFTLTVPTGGGKTLASLAFALDHAIGNGLDRVIYAIPFTSIVEQTANVFRDVFGDLDPDAVLEHHSNLDPDDPEGHNTRSRLAAENWDAPLVVTTNIQLLESLFANRTSKCRKLHRLAGSVVILDEAQTIPVEVLGPCLAILRELARNYRCTIVLCTATQPALLRRESFFPIGLEPTNVREIVPPTLDQHERMRRVDVAHVGTLPDDELVDRLADIDQVLCIVNTKPHAAAVFAGLRDRLPDDNGTFHLSTRLCGQHRHETLTTVRERLNPANPLPCRVVSTQLIEAGVDVDFSVVYRSLAGIDSLAQAAGRCNREGRLDRGRVFVFEPSEQNLIGYLRSTVATARELVGLPEHADLLAPATVRRYFELLYDRNRDQSPRFDGRGGWDHAAVMEGFGTDPNALSFQFRQIADRFRMIPDDTRPILVPHGKKGRELIDRLRVAPPDRFDLRHLQRYAVGVREAEYKQWLDTGNAELVHDRHAVLINADAYDPHLGLCADRIGYMAVDTSIV